MEHFTLARYAYLWVVASMLRGVGVLRVTCLVLSLHAPLQAHPRPLTVPDYWPTTPLPYVLEVT